MLIFLIFIILRSTSCYAYFNSTYDILDIVYSRFPRHTSFARDIYAHTTSQNKLVRA